MTINKADEGSPSSSVQNLPDGIGEPIVEVADLEELAKAGLKPPRARIYRFKVNSTICNWSEPTITGREILEQASLTPPDQYRLRQKIVGSPPKRIELIDVVDLREPGVEKFRAIKRDQTEGESQDRRAAPVLDQDRIFLDRYGLQWEIVVDGSTWLLLHNFPLPHGYTLKAVLLAIRLESGYPLTALDMMYAFPSIARCDGKPIPNVDAMQALDGKQFQRWSRHRTAANPWTPGEDSLETHIYLVEEYFRAEFAR